jgi:hypothetical protein
MPVETRRGADAPLHGPCASAAPPLGSTAKRIRGESSNFVRRVNAGGIAGGRRASKLDTHWQLKPESRGTKEGVCMMTRVGWSLAITHIFISSAARSPNAYLFFPNSTSSMSWPFLSEKVGQESGGKWCEGARQGQQHALGVRAAALNQSRTRSKGLRSGGQYGEPAHVRLLSREKAQLCAADSHLDGPPLEAGHSADAALLPPRPVAGHLAPRDTAGGAGRRRGGRGRRLCRSASGQAPGALPPGGRCPLADAGGDEGRHAVGASTRKGRRG